MAKNRQSIKIISPSSNTRLSINVADYKIDEVANHLIVIASILSALNDGKYVIDKLGYYHIFFEGEADYPNIDISYSEYDSDDKFDMNAFIVSSSFDGSVTDIKLSKEIVIGLLRGLTFGEAFKEFSLKWY